MTTLRVSSELLVVARPTNSGNFNRGSKKEGKFPRDGDEAIDNRYSINYNFSLYSMRAYNFITNLIVRRKGRPTIPLARGFSLH